MGNATRMGLEMRAARQGWAAASWAQRLAMLALFVLPALVVTTPVNLLPFGVLLLLSSVLGIGALKQRRLPAAVLVAASSVTVSTTHQELSTHH